MPLSIEELANIHSGTIAAYDPAAVAQSLFATMERLSINGGDIKLVDPSNPFVLALTNQAIMTSVMMEQASDLNRAQYPYMARNQNELYHHMSDMDYYGRFANPSRVTCMFRCQVDDLMQVMVEVPELNQFKVVIPRNSFLTVDSMEFTMLYPIVIRRQRFGKFSVTYDTDLNSPLMDLETNLIPFETVRSGGVDWFTFEFELVQCNITSKRDTITPAADTYINVAFPDEFHYCRAFNVSTAGGVKRRTELSVTHSDLIFNPNKPTVLVRVTPGNLSVYLPTIYASNGMTGAIEVDVYSTKGRLDMPLGGYAMTEFTFEYRSTFSEEINEFVAPLSIMNTVDVFSKGTTSGGSDAMSFDDLKEQVISNGLGDPTVPVSSVKLKYALRALGYDVSLAVDNLSTRVFLATRDLPLPKDNRLHSPVASVIETFSFSGDMSAISSAIIENKNSYTITPKALFQINNGIVTLQSDGVLDALSLLPPDKLAEELSLKPYFWTPFYYVIDTSDNRLSLRPYYLDKPEITSMSFETENTTTPHTCTTSGYNIEKTSDGFVIYVYTTVSDEYYALSVQEVWAQLLFLPEGSNVYAAVNGKLYGTLENGHIWQFDIKTNYYVDKNHNLNLTNFTMYDGVQRNIGISFKPTFSLVFGVDTTLSSAFRAVSTDDIIARHLLTRTAKSITHEYINVRFGDVLDTMWAQARSFSDAKYQVYPTDVPLRYKADVFAPFENGDLVKIINGNVEYNKVHCAGDVVHTPDGEPEYISRKGDYVIDAVSGLPVPVADRYMIRNLDLLFMEASFRFTTSATARTYFENTLLSIITWCVKDMVSLKPRLLDETEIYFTPKRTAASVGVQVLNTLQYIQAPQALTVRYTVSDDIAKQRLDRDRTDIERTTAEVLASTLSKSIISTTDLSKALKDAVGGEVLNVEVTGFGGEKNLRLVIIPSTNDRLTIAKRVKARASGEVYIEDDITVIIEKERDTYNLN